MGEILFQSVETASSSDRCGCSSPSEFALLSDGTTLARVEKPIDNSDGCLISLCNSENIDLRTKALLIFTGYIMVS